MINLKQLETFVSIASLGSFRLAAKQLCTTQPAISVRISNLEETLNTSLFKREKGNVVLTPKGRALLPMAENILSSTTQFMYKANGSNALSGLIKIGVSETIVHTWLPTFLATINKRYPAIEIELVVDATVNLSKELLAHNIDIAILLGPISSPQVINYPVGEYPLHWVSSPEIAMKLDLSSQHFTNWPIITYSRNTAPYHAIQRHFSEKKMSSVRYYSVSALSASIKLAESGVGIAILPKEVIQSQLQDGSLTVIDAKWTPEPLKFTASYIKKPDDLLIEEVVNIAIKSSDKGETIKTTSTKGSNGSCSGTHL
ncbi:LysR family transcriptional regulator [Vibrio litoralis]|uniref:LysR family transcriptional regulator n=1 Tax=Vibrio litoralis TaxID=335972 RepID=UPI0003F5F7E0|nr:LysR family transcriptional regulator [Vibrio litoralis]